MGVLSRSECCFTYMYEGLGVGVALTESVHSYIQEVGELGQLRHEGFMADHFLLKGLHEKDRLSHLLQYRYVAYGAKSKQCYLIWH